jgi:hypothetical protein
MKGYIPSSLMNMLLASEVGKNLESLYKGIRKQRDNEAFKALYQNTSGPLTLMAA